MSVWRIQLKPKSDKGQTCKDIVNFCQKQGIIGVGWRDVEIYEYGCDVLRKACDEKYPNDNGAYKAINAMRKMRVGDLIWTRMGGDAYIYYLCKVTDIWKNRKVTNVEYEMGVANFVKVEWAEIGTVDKVPGHVVNTFRISATAQGVKGVDEASQFAWNRATKSDDYDVNLLNKDNFWSLVGDQDLETIIFLYLQKNYEYYVYKNTAKRDNAKYECVMVNSNDYHKAYLQVKMTTDLDPDKYVEGIHEPDRVFLFTTSEEYHDKEDKYKNVICLKKAEVWDFIEKNRNILPESVNAWFDNLA